VNMARKIRRCAILFVEPRDGFDLDLAGLFSGRNAAVARTRWVALAPHLDGEVELETDEMAALGRIGSGTWIEADERTVASDVLERLVAKGIVVVEGDATANARDEQLRASHWSPLAAASHYFSRWTDAGMDGRADVSLRHSLADVVEEFGMPPPHVVEKSDQRVPLAHAQASALHALMQQRATCRNFMRDAALDGATFAALMQRVFASHGDVELHPGVRALKKSNPSGGGLHPLEAYVLVRHIDGIAPGRYLLVHRIRKGGLIETYPYNDVSCAAITLNAPVAAGAPPTVTVSPSRHACAVTYQRWGMKIR